jgi:hypothetical protein
LVDAVPPAPPLKLGEPVVVAVSAPNETRWGFTQFPAYSPLPDGRILLVYADAEDASETHGGDAPSFVSADQGETWTRFTNDLVPSRPHFSVTPAYDGEFLVIPAIRYLNVQEANVTLPKPVSEAYVYGPFYTYRVGDFSPEVQDYYRNLSARRWIPAIKQWQDETITYQTKDLLAWRRENSDVMPRTFFERPALKHKGELMYADYRVRYATEDGHYPSKGGTNLMVSNDNGRSFTKRSIVALDLNGQDLFGEPALEATTDGGLVAVIRRADHEQKPMAICFSKDDGHTWTAPADFCNFGVFPYLIRLPSNLLVVSYGRPGVWLRFNLDGNGRDWTDPVCLIPGDASTILNHTCGYTSMHVLGPRSFLVTYSDFDHRDADGTPRKAIISRRVDLDD